MARKPAAGAKAAAENVIVITASDNISAAKSFISELRSYRTYTFDPGLVDELMAQGFANVEFINCPNAPDYPNLVHTSHQQAIQLERALDEAVRDVLPDISIFSWQHLNFYYLLIAARWYNAMWLQLADRFEGTLPHIFVNDNPATYYWPSFLPAVALLEILKSRGIEFKAFNYGARADETGAIPMLFDGKEDEQWDVLAHLPTCFYDANYFWDEIRGSGLSSVNLAPKYWSVPDKADKAVGLIFCDQVMHLLTDEFRATLVATKAILSAALDKFLEPFIRTEIFRQRQVEHFVKLYEAQLVTYEALENYFGATPPRCLLLSDHDSGFHGPLATFAAQYKVKVFILPHSKTLPDLEIRAEQAIGLMHPSQGEDILALDGKRVLKFKLAFPEAMSADTTFIARPKTIGLLLNGFSLNGVFVTDYSVYLGGILRIKQWCDAAGVTLRVRCRPGHTIKNILVTEAGIPMEELNAGLAGTMQDFAAGVDLCLMYDTPTTGAIEFLRRGIPILNPIVDNLSKYEACMAPAELVPRNSVEATLTRVHDFLHDEGSFAEFKRKQFAGYTALFADAHPLRAFL